MSILAPRSQAASHGMRLRFFLAAFGLLLLACTTLRAKPCLEPLELASTGTPRAEARPDPASPLATPPFHGVCGGPGATLHLLGTIHLGPEAGWSLPPEIDRALAQASTLVMELDQGEATEEAVSNAVVRHAVLPGTSPLSKMIGPETTQALDLHDRELAAAGLPRRIREALKPWFIALSLIESTSLRTGYTTTRSIDLDVFNALGSRELVALETLDEQFELFAGLSFELQELILQDTLMRWETAPESIEELVQAWRHNDEKALARLAREGTDTLPQLEAFFEVLIDDRNRSWLPTLVELLESPERAGTTVFVAVGALHLVGPGSVPELLREAGYRVESGSFQP